MINFAHSVPRMVKNGGSTTIIALILDDHVVVASVGGASGVFAVLITNIDSAGGWRILEHEDEEINKIRVAQRALFTRK